MADKKAMNALFIMCTALKKEVEELRAEVKELHESRETFVPRPVAESVLTLTNVYNDAIEYSEKEVTRLETDIDEIREHVKEHEEWRKAAVERVVALETNVLKGKANSVRPNIPERFQQKYHRKPVQVRQRRERLCYNCRKPGHEARQCNKPNPRNQNLSAPDNNKPTLSGILKRKLPESNLVKPSTEPESNKQAQSLSVGAYEPRISLNPRLAGYDMNKLGICVTPYRSEATRPPEW